MTLTPAHVRRIAAVLDTDDATSIVKLARLAELPPSRAFRSAILRGANFRDEQDLTNFDFTGADFAGADVRGANFSGAVGLDHASLRDVIADETTHWPTYLQRPGPMVRIRAGTFLRGATAAEHKREKVPKSVADSERPREHITIDHDFLLGKYPVTVGEFRRFVGDKGYTAEKGAFGWDQAKGAWDMSQTADWNNPGFPQDDTHPVTCISLGDALAYVQYLSERTSQTYRLPSEAEWEYACRAGIAKARFWGDDRAGAAKYANVADFSLARAMNAEPEPERFFQFDDGFPFTSPVGSFAANPWGLFDMLGNAWEWCADHYAENYKDAPKNGAPYTTGSGDGPRVLRGGSWSDNLWVVRAASRGRSDPGNRNSIIGFRVARTL